MNFMIDSRLASNRTEIVAGRGRYRTKIAVRERFDTKCSRLRLAVTVTFSTCVGHILVYWGTWKVMSGTL